MDIKFNKTDISGALSLTPGTNVAFTLATLPDGRVQAKQVTPNGTGGGMKRPASAISSPFGGLSNPLLALTTALAAGGNFNFQPAKQMRITPKAPKVQGADTPTGQYANGTIKSYNSQKGFGFISSPAVAGDVFFMRTSLPAEMQNVGVPGALQNANVTFELVHAADGKLRAQNVTMG